MYKCKIINYYIRNLTNIKCTFYYVLSNNKNPLIE